MRLPRTKRTRIAVALSAVAADPAALALGVADSAPPPESGPEVETHVDHSYIYIVDVQTRELTQETTERGRARAVLVGRGRDRLQHQTATSAPRRSAVDAAGSPEVPIDTNVEHLFQPSWAPDGKGSRRSGSAAASTWTTRTAPRRAHRPGRRTRRRTGRRAETGSRSTGRFGGTNYDIFAVNAATGEERRLTNDRSSRRIPPGRRTATGWRSPSSSQREVGDRHDEHRRHRAQAGHRPPDQRPGARLVARRQEDRLHPAGAGQGHASPSIDANGTGSAEAPDRRQALPVEADLVAGRQEHRVRRDVVPSAYELRQ